MLSEASIELPGGPDRPICTVGRDRRTRLGTPVGLASLRRHLFRRVSTSHSKLTVTCRYPRRRVSITMSDSIWYRQHVLPYETVRVHLFLFWAVVERKQTIRAQGGGLTKRLLVE